ncbi:MAG: amino acid ABC transporter permease [Clostridia bacterium]
MTFAYATQQLLVGFVVTLELFGLTLVCSLPLGLLVAFGSMSKFKIIKFFTKGIVWIVRGTPLLLQIIVVFYVPALLFDMSIDSRLLAVAIAFVINYSCYFSEIYRGGIEGIPKGQYEAGKVLGMTKRQIFIKIVMLQVIKRIVPPMSNEIITLVKDTSLARVISVIELNRAAEKLVNVYGILWPLFYAGVFYLVFNGILSILFSKIEKKLNYYQG